MKKALKIIAFVLAGVLILCSLFIVRACSAPPEYSEIRERVEELIKASHDVNEVVWGKGLETYERVFDPISSLDIYPEKKLFLELTEGDDTSTVRYNYYRVLNAEHTIYAFREESNEVKPYRFAYLSEEKLDKDKLKELFPSAEDDENESYYSEVYSDEESGKVAYRIPYEDNNKYYFYRTSDKDYNVFAYRKQLENTAKYTYAVLSDKKINTEELKKLFPKSKDHADSELYYTEILCDEATSRYAYCVPYTESQYFYYVSSDPEDYDYVLLDSEYGSVDEIKAYIRTVYSEKYAESLDSTLFDGILEGSMVSKARYTMQFNYRLGGNVLVQLNTYEPKFTERRVYLFETAKIDRNSSNKKEVAIEFETYLPSNPNKKITTKIYVELQDGQWFLSTPTY